MTIEALRHTIFGDSPGRTTELNGFRIGQGRSGKKAYLQGALHTDEQPGIMALTHFLEMLIAADKRGEVQGEIVLFPMVNPIGMGNIEFGMHQGRYDVVSGVNFNRDWPDLFNLIKDDIQDSLGTDATINRRCILDAVKTALAIRPGDSARQQLRKTTLLEACDADYVFDLHCDDDSLLHIFCGPHCTAQMQKLSNWLHGSAILTAADSGGGSFDEVLPMLWLNTAEAFPECNIPQTVAGCTIELRGQIDVFDALGQQDANALYRFFQSEGLINGDPGEVPDSKTSPTPLNATEVVRSTVSGLLAYKVNIGDRVTKGDVIAEVIRLDGENAFVERESILAGASGKVLSRKYHKYVWPGSSVAKIVGTEPIETRGAYLLED